MIWTDPFLDEMRTHADPLADAVVAEIFAKGEVGAVDALMKTLVRNDGIPSELLPPVVQDYLAATNVIPDLDPEAQRRAERLFSLLGPEILMVLGFYSLPAAYAGKKGVQVLYRTAYLMKRPVRRVFETTQLVVDAMAPGGLSAGGKGLRTAQKVRLMHAAIRHLVMNDPSKPWDAHELGLPINQEDYAGTLTTFTWVLLDGLERLKIEVDDADKEAWVQAWGSLGRVLGIRDDMIPKSWADAGVLADRIHTRQLGPSPEGVALTQALVEGYQSLMPSEHLKGMPASFLHFFLDSDPFTHQNVAAMLQVPPADWTEELTRVATVIGDALEFVSKHFDLGARLLRWVGREMVRGMLLMERGGQRPPFAIPPTLASEWEV